MSILTYFNIGFIYWKNYFIMMTAGGEKFWINFRSGFQLVEVD